MRSLYILVILITTQIAICQVQITNIKDLKRQIVQDWLYEDREGDRYYIFLETDRNFVVNKLQNDEFIEICRFQENWTSISHVEVPDHKRFHKNLFFQTHRDSFIITDLISGDFLHSFSPFLFGESYTDDFNIINDKIYFGSTHAGTIFNLNTFEITRTPNSNAIFLGRILDKFYFIDKSEGQIYLFNESTKEIDLIYDSPQIFIDIESFGSTKNQSFLISGLDGSALKIDRNGYSEMGKCSFQSILDIDYSLSVILGDKILMSVREDDSTKVIIYDLSSCTITLDEMIGSNLFVGEFVTNPDFDEDFVILYFKYNNQIMILIDPLNNKITKIDRSETHLKTDRVISRDSNLYMIGTVDAYGSDRDNIIKINKKNHNVSIIEIPQNVTRKITLSNNIGEESVSLMSTNSKAIADFYTFNFKNESFIKDNYEIPSIETQGLNSLRGFAIKNDKLAFINWRDFYFFDGDSKFFESPLTKSSRINLTEDKLSFVYNTSLQDYYLSIDFEDHKLDSKQIEFESYLNINHKFVTSNINSGGGISYYKFDTGERIEVSGPEVPDYPIDLYSDENKIVFALLEPGTNFTIYKHDVKDNTTKKIMSFEKEIVLFQREKFGFTLGIQDSISSSIKYWDSNLNEKFSVNSNSNSIPFSLVSFNNIHGELLTISESDEALLVSEHAGVQQSHFIQSDSFPIISHKEDLAIINVKISNDFYTYIYDFLRSPVFFPESKGLKLRHSYKEGKNILLFYENSERELEVYRIIAQDKLELVSYHPEISFSFHSQNFVAKLDTNRLVLNNIVSEEFGDELHTYNLKTKSIDVLKDINPNGNSIPFHMTATESAIYFTADNKNENRQWYRLELDDQLQSGLPNFEFDISPSLTTDYIKSNQGLDKIEIYDIKGSLILSIDDYQSYHAIDVSEYPAGMYIVRGQKGEHTHSQKIVKQ